VPNITYILDSFATGEIDPQMQTKVSLAKYKTALKVQRNFFTHVNGATSNRSGTIYVAPTKFSTTNQSAVKNTKLIPFQFSTTQSYMLEVGDFYVRFYKNDAPVQVPNTLSTIWNVSVSYTQTQFVTYNSIVYTWLQSNMAAEPDTSPTEWSPLPVGTYTPQYESGFSYKVGAFVISNFITYYCIQAGTGQTPVSSPTYWTPQIIYEVPTIYPQSVVMQLGYTQSADTLFLANQNYPSQMLQRITDTYWTISAYPFVGGPFQLDNTNQGYTLTASAFHQPLSDNSLIPVGVSVTLAASGAGNAPFQSGHVGALWQLFHYVPNQEANATISSSGPTGSISCGGTWRLITNGTWTGTVWMEKSLDGGVTWLQLNSFYGAADFNANTYGTEDMSNNAPPFLVRGNCTLSSGSVQFTVTADPYIQPGIISITSFQSSTVVYGVVQQPVGLDNTATTDWAEGAWSNVQGFPSIVEFTPDDRLMLANSKNFPENSWLSKTSDYFNFNVSNPLVDSDALNITLPSRQINGINGLIPLRAIVALTTNSEWSVESTQGVSAPLTPSTIYQRVHGYEGSQGVKPVLIGIRAIFIQQLGKIIRDIGYELIYDAFVGANLSIFSNHLFFFNTIIDMAYQKNPDSIVWMVRNDGQLISMTYLREQSVVSFARHDTNGYFLCIASLANSIINFDEVWVIVNRTNGQFVERFSQRMITANNVCNDGSTIVDVAQQIFMDCTTTIGAVRVSILSIVVGNPTVVTTNAAHGFTNGQQIKLFNLTVNTQFNNTTWIIGSVTSTTFALITEV